MIQLFEGGGAATRAAVSRLAGSVASRFDGPPVDRDDVVDRVRTILADPRYVRDEPTILERLLGPLYDWLERMIAIVWEIGTRVVAWFVRLLATNAMTAIGPIVVLVAAAAATWVLARRRARDIERRATIERILEIGTDPDELEARAVGADDAGDHAEAIRLRFVAGLLRLDADGRIDFYPGLSNGAISERLGDPTFDGLATQFDQVVYGKKPASRGDSRSAADRWAALTGAKR